MKVTERKANWRSAYSAASTARRALYASSPALEMSDSMSLSKNLLQLFEEIWRPTAAGASASHKLRVAAFMPTPTEPNLLPFLQWARIRGWTVFLPHLDEGASWTSTAHPATWTRMGMSSTGEVPTHLDAVLVPGVVFDVGGSRLGRGAGWYDRALEKLPASVWKVGVTFPNHVVARGALPTSPWDQEVDFLVTSDGVRDCKSRGVRTTQ